MNLIINILIIWIACAAVCYYIQREDHKAINRKWTRIDRVFVMFISMIYGPCMLLAIGCISIYSKLCDSQWAKQEAKW